jgi:hypothetical protein
MSRNHFGAAHRPLTLRNLEQAAMAQPLADINKGYCVRIAKLESLLAFESRRVRSLEAVLDWISTQLES